MATYGGDWFAYDFAAALEQANAGPRESFSRLYDRLKDGYERGSKLPATVGLFDGRYCRRCEATFAHPAFDRREHWDWHRWLDENANIERPTRDFETAVYETLNKLPTTVEPVGKVVPWGPVSDEDLDRHKEKFSPPKAKDKVAHDRAVEEVRAMYGAGEDAPTDWAQAMWDDGWPLTEIEKETGWSVYRLKKHLGIAA